MSSSVDASTSIVSMGGRIVGAAAILPPINELHGSEHQPPPRPIHIDWSPIPTHTHAMQPHFHCYSCPFHMVLFNSKTQQFVLAFVLLRILTPIAQIPLVTSYHDTRAL